MALTRRGFFSLLAALPFVPAKPKFSFKDSPILRYWNGLKYEGKPIVADQYAPMIGGSYKPGSDFNIGSRRTITRG